MSDRLPLVNAIGNTGIPRDKAERVASVIFDAIHDNLATKADTASLATKADLQELRTEIEGAALAALREAKNEEIVRSHGVIDGLRAGMARAEDRAGRAETSRDAADTDRRVSEAARDAERARADTAEQAAEARVVAAEVRADQAEAAAEEQRCASLPNRPKPRGAHSGAGRASGRRGVASELVQCRAE